MAGASKNALAIAAATKRKREVAATRAAAAKRAATAKRVTASKQAAKPRAKARPIPPPPKAKPSSSYLKKARQLGNTVGNRPSPVAKKKTAVSIRTGGSARKPQNPRNPFNTAKIDEAERKAGSSYKRGGVVRKKKAPRRK